MAATRVPSVDPGLAPRSAAQDGRRAALVPVLGLVALLVVGATVVRGGIEQALEDRILAELATVPGARDLDVEIVGRAARLDGEVAPDVDLDAVTAAAGAVEGVRAVEVGAVEVGEVAATRPTELVLTVSEEGAVLSGEVSSPVDVSGLTAALGGVAVVDRTTTSPDAPASPGSLRLRGQVPTTFEREAVVAAAATLLSDPAGVDDRLEVAG